MEEWKSYKMGDLFTLEYGKPVEDKDSIDGPIPVFGTNGQIGTSHLAPLCNHPSVILGRKGAYRGVHFSDRPFSVIDTAFYVEPISDVFDIKWLYYKLLTYDINSMDSGSAIPSTDRYQIYSLSIDLPSLEVQKRTVRVLDSINDKIALNNRINHNLEEQAKALYKSWFVDFEPFKDGKFIDSELGLIPEGWRVATLGEVTSEMRDKVGTRQDVKVLSPVTTGQLVLSEEFFTKQVFSESIAKYLIVRPNDFAYNPARVNIGSLGKNEFDFDGCVSPVYVVFRCETGYEHFFDLYRTMKPFKEEVISRSNGGVRQTLGYKDFALIKLVYPPMSVIKEFNTIYDHMLMGMKQCGIENTSLAKQRDELLPKLMMGDICPRDLTC